MSKALDLRNYTKLVPTPLNEITKEQFEVYERIHIEGKTNMLDLETVEILSDGILVPSVLKAIQQNFRTLQFRFENEK